MGRIRLKKAVRALCCLLTAMAVILADAGIPLFRMANVAKAASPIVERAISWAISIANDNSHGYSRSNRWGPDYDCSSFVISAFRNAGVNVGAATYTGNMRAQFTQHGFRWIPWSQLGGASNLQRGDILLNEVQHTEIYLGNNQNVGAHSNRGYPQTGDQTGTEISVSGYYYHPWNGVLRYTGSSGCNCSTDYAGDYYVSTNSLPLTMRSGHGTGYSVVTSIPKGSKVYVSRADGSWAHVQWNGYSGYCSMGYLTKITEKSYRLHVWVSDTKMGDIPSEYVKGRTYYICYELIDESTGKRANETGNINYDATESIKYPDGRVWEYTYNNSDNNWIRAECSSEGTYTGTVTISGDVGITCTVSFDIKADTWPQMDVWTWNDVYTKEITTAYVGEKVYCSCKLIDKYTGDYLNKVNSIFAQSGDGYTVTIKVYDPSNSLIETGSYKNNDYMWLTFVPDKIGDYKIKADITGNLTGGMDITLKAVEKEHKYGSWSITENATCTQAGTRTRTCSICGTRQSETIPAAGHKSVTDKAVEPTETRTGWTEGAHCSVCGKVIIPQMIIPRISPKPSPTPSLTPVPTATADPTAKPTVKPTATAGSTAKPTVKPTATAGPTAKPTVKPTATAGPTAKPTVKPTATAGPTAKPTVKPTATAGPTADPMVSPAAKPTMEPVPTPAMTAIPAVRPTGKPGTVNTPAVAPTEAPSSSSAVPDAVSTGNPAEAELRDIEEYSNTYDDSELDEEHEPVKGTILYSRKSGVSYKVLKQGETVEFYRVNNKKVEKAAVPDMISVDGVKYKVTAISGNAFNGCKNLKYAFIGRNVSVIGNKAFYQCRLLKEITIPDAVVKIGRKAFCGCKKLEKVVIKSGQLEGYAVGAQAFGHTYRKMTIKVPKDRRKAYAKWLRKKGVSKMAKVEA